MASLDEFGALMEIGADAVMAMALNGPIVAFAPIGTGTDLAAAGIALIDEVRSSLAASEAIVRGLTAV